MQCTAFRKLFYLLILLTICSLTAPAQPYFDPVSLVGWWQPGTTGEQVTGEEYYGNISLSVPLSAGKNRRLVLSPFLESRQLDPVAESKSLHLYSSGLPVTMLFFLNDTGWVINATAIVRNNDDALTFSSDEIQTGGLILNTVKINSGLKIKFGLYYNREFFSDFFIPLVGVEYKVSPRLQLFGTLPNYMKLEYKAGEKIYTGAAFKSITNSYRDEFSGGYFKISDNHLSVYADYYISSKIVFSLEAGHTIFRKVKSRETTFPYTVESDSFLLKAGLFYRIRF